MTLKQNNQLAIAVALCALLLAPDSAKAEWYPLEIDVWDPPFNTDLKRKTDQYTPLKKAEKTRLPSRHGSEAA